MTQYQQGETITLEGTVTPDNSDDLEDITVTVSLKSNSEMILEYVEMTLDESESTSMEKHYYYDYTIPTTYEGRVFWWITVTGASGRATIEKDKFYIEQL